MEQRNFSRTDIRVPVDIFRNDKLVGQYVTRNIGMEGVSIEAVDTDLVKNDFIYIRIAGLNHDVLTSGLIVHMEDCCVGVLFMDSTLLDLLRDRQEPKTEIALKIKEAITAVTLTKK